MVRTVPDTPGIPTKRSRLYALLTSPRLVLVLLLLPVAVFFVYFFALRYNIPWFDEFENIPYFLDRFLNATSLSERMAALLRPNNEHRVAYARLVVLAQYALTGGLNFSNLMLWGNAGLLLIFYLLYVALRRHEQLRQRAWVGLLPVPLLLFTAQNYLLTFTAIFTLQYLAIVMLVMLTLFVLTTSRWNAFGLAVALGVLATFSMGNGLLLWPAGAAMLLVQRRWPALAVWLLVGAGSSYGYFLGYPVQQGNSEGFAYLVQHPLQTVAGFLIFAGSVFDLLPMLPESLRYYLPFVAGLGLMTTLSYWLVRTLFRPAANQSFFDVFVLGCLLFLLANIGLIALFRLRFYFAMVLHGSYRIYSMALWSVALVLLFSRLSERNRARFWPGIWVVFAGMSVLSYASYVPEAMERRKHMEGLTFNQKYSNIGLGGTRNSELARYISELVKLMRDRGWYELPEPAIAPGEHALLTPGQPASPTVPLRIDQKPDYVVVSSDEASYTVGLQTGTYLIMQSDRHTYLMLGNRNRPTGRKLWQVPPGFSSAMPTSMLEPGRYRIGLFRTAPEQRRIQFTSQYVTVQ